MDTLLSDVQFAIRSLAKSKLYTTVALASLALGIGANVTVFSIVNALAFKPLPYVDADRLVDVHAWSATKLCGGCGVGTSFPTFLDWRANARSFAGMGAYFERPFSVSGIENAERVGGALVSAEVFDLLGIHASIGRGFQADDDRVGAPPVVLLSDALWTRRYGADRRIVGQTIRINGSARTVIGVMPPRFKFPEFAELWVPFIPNVTSTARDVRDFGVVARLARNASLATANTEMAVIAQGIARQSPQEEGEWTAQVAPLRSQFGAMPPSAYVVLLGAVGFVLLIVCANLAGLLLARGATRQREIAIRLALGATRRQIVRHLLTESVILSCAGGALGMLVATWGVDLFIQNVGRQAPFYVDFGFDRTSLLFSVVLSVVTGVLFGLLPALRSSAADVSTTLKESASSVQRSHVRGLLVIGELALALVLLAGAGELTKSFLKISTPEQGYDERDLLTGNLEFLDAKYHDPAAVRFTLNDIVDRLRQIPGATSATMDRMEFIAGFGQGDQAIQAEGVASVQTGVSPRFYHVVTPGYFSTLKMSLLAGRDFSASDRIGTTPVVVINKRLAEALWPNASPLGRRIKLGPADTLPWLTVVGIVGDVSNLERPRNYAYVSADQFPGTGATLLLRAGSEPGKLIPAVRAAVRAVDPDLPVLELQTVAQKQHHNYWPYEMYAVVMGTFASFAVLLAAIGLYGVIAYNTAQRTREIGVRVALGAEAKHVVALIARQGGRLVVLGVVFGIAGSAVLLRVMQSMLFGVSPVDFAIFAAGSAVLAGVALIAVWVPARRAARVDPTEALRAE
jgi:predicted permease